MRSQRIRRNQIDRTVALPLSRRDRGLVAVGILLVAFVDGACAARDRIEAFVTRKDPIR